MFILVITLRGHEQVDALQHVEEELVAPVLDALAPPADLPRHLVRNLTRLFLRLENLFKKMLMFWHCTVIFKPRG